MNLIAIHGANGVITFEEQIRKACAELGIPFINPIFPTKHSSYTECSKVLLRLLDSGKLNDDTIALTHSAGGIVLPLFIAENNVKIDTDIALAGFMGKLKFGVKLKIQQMLLKRSGFHLREQQLQAASKLIKNRHAFFSNNDHLISLKELEKYAETFNAEKHFVPDIGHMSRTKNITNVPGLSEVIMESAKKIITKRNNPPKNALN